MNRDKQIEEMERTIEKLCDEKPADFCNINNCHKCLAADLYNAGYRKASEVAQEIIDILKSVGIDEWRYPMIAEIRKKYTEGGK